MGACARGSLRPPRRSRPDGAARLLRGRDTRKTPGREAVAINTREAGVAARPPGPGVAKLTLLPYQRFLRAVRAGEKL